MRCNEETIAQPHKCSIAASPANSHILIPTFESFPQYPQFVLFASLPPPYTYHSASFRSAYTPFCFAITLFLHFGSSFLYPRLTLPASYLSSSSQPISNSRLFHLSSPHSPTTLSLALLSLSFQPASLNVSASPCFQESCSLREVVRQHCCPSTCPLAYLRWPLLLPLTTRLKAPRFNRPRSTRARPPMASPSSTHRLGNPRKRAGTGTCTILRLSRRREAVHC